MCDLFVTVRAGTKYRYDICKYYFGGINNYMLANIIMKFKISQN